MIYLYAVGDAREPPAHLTGLDDAPVHAISSGGVTAFASEHADLELAAKASALWKHENVVEKLMDEATVLPMRFGSKLPDVAAVRAMLVERGAELSTALERVRGAVELGLRVLGERAADGSPPRATVATSASTARPGPGTTYLLQRLERSQEVETLVERVHEPLAALARASRRRRLDGSRFLLTGAYLVERDLVETFRSRVEELDAENPVSIVCTGPWPPYGFSSLDEEPW
jgi:Gas vesicle synthesis protein GvpL/GvpF